MTPSRLPRGQPTPSMPIPSLLRFISRWLLPAAALLSLSLPVPARELVAVRLIAFNDLHGHLEPGDNSIAAPDPRDPTQRIALRTGGLAYLASAVQQHSRRWCSRWGRPCCS